MNSLSTFGKILSLLLLFTYTTCASELLTESQGLNTLSSTTQEKVLPPIQDQQQEVLYQCWLCRTLGPKSGNNEANVKKTEATEMSIYDVMFLFALYWAA